MDLSLILSAIVVGDGLPVCLLHGLFGRAQNLTMLARRLGVTRRVVSLDLRNHGASSHAPGMCYADMADDVLQTLHGLDALPCAMLGHSMGGKVAMTASLSAPAQVRALVVADIAPVAYRHRNAGVASALLALEISAPGFDRRRADGALATAIPDPSIRGFLLQNLAFGAVPAWKIGLEEIAAGMPDIEGWALPMAGAVYRGPALFITGARSDYVSAADLPAIEALFPAAGFVSVERAGHWLHADQPDAFGDAVSDFLDAADAEPG